MHRLAAQRQDGKLSNSLADLQVNTVLYARGELP
jgi:hypothetical protein